jgi:TPR repeat protein
MHILTHPLTSYWHFITMVFTVASGLLLHAPFPHPYHVPVWHRSGLYMPAISGPQALRLSESTDAHTRDLGEIFIAIEQVSGHRHAISLATALGLATLEQRCDTDTDRSARAYACYWLGVLRSQNDAHDPAVRDDAAAQIAFAKGIAAGSAQSAYQAGVMLKFGHHEPTVPTLRLALEHAQATLGERVRPGMSTGEALIRLSAAQGYHTGCYQYADDLISDYLRLRHTHPAAARILHQRGARWMVTAATLPYASESAERYLGDAWANGFWHLQVSTEKAARWYTKALHDGSPRAGVALALLYGAHEITPPSAPSAPVRAYADALIAAVLTRAGSAENERAIHTQQMVGAPLDAAQRRQAVAYAHRLVAHYPRLSQAMP